MYFWLVDTMYKRYSSPGIILNSMSWNAIPGFIENLAKETQKEQLYEFWVEHYQYIQVPFGEFLKDSQQQQNNNDSNDNISQLNSEERKQEIRRREAKSNWNLTEIT